MRAHEVRETFLSFYEARDHRRVPSSSLIPTDPTVLFTIAGMVQFKPFFLGQQDPPIGRATSVQKCFRTENIEDVGNNAKDCTFFEMLGNFSFGDYFKREACPWAWELLTGPFGVDPSRLWVTVFEDDDETAQIWREVVGVDASRVLRFPKEDNFWHMGVAGPCGPCTELYIDRGPAYGPEGERGPADVPERYQEIYNLVFMQFVQDRPFHVVGDLERHGVDTGMGLERLVQILQDVPTVFDTDLFVPVIERAEQLTGASRERDDERKLLHIVADHARAVSFLIADGVAPSNEGRGQVLRRVLRRAVTKARLAGVATPVLRPLCEVVLEHFAPAYPELGRYGPGVLEMVEREEQRFSRTLDAALGMLTSEMESATGTLSGEVAFVLHDTYGLPVEITADVAADAGLQVDMDGFERHMTEQRERSRAHMEREGQQHAADLKVSAPPTAFLGYETLEADARVLAILSGAQGQPAAAEGEEVQIVLDRTPFYAEGGGQVGDRGWIQGPAGRAEVLGTQARGGVYLHTAKVSSGELHVDDEVQAVVGPEHRRAVEPAHTATHMAHHTLRTVLGGHVRQMGSLVEPGRLRFDFSHFEGVGRDVLDEIEETVNARIADDDPVEWFHTSYRHAVDELGAVAFFEEKYGDEVRVVQVGDYSRELCGGTHVTHTGRVGFVKVLSEGSIASNVRRIDALTGVEGLRWVNRRLRLLEQASELVRTPPEEVAEGVERLLRVQKDLQRQLDAERGRQAASAAEQLLASARQIGEARLLVARRDEDPDTLQKLAVSLRDRLGRSVVVLGAAGEGGVRLVGTASKELVGTGLDAKDILRAGAAAIGGGAGGKPDLARAGGNRPEGLDEALALCAKQAEQALGG